MTKDIQIILFEDIEAFKCIMQIHNRFRFVWCAFLVRQECPGSLMFINIKYCKGQSQNPVLASSNVRPLWNFTALNLYIEGRTGKLTRI